VQLMERGQTLAPHKRIRNKSLGSARGTAGMWPRVKSSKPLPGDEGKHIKTTDEGEGAAKAYARYLLQVEQPPA
jgi:hypothetical protein